MIWHDCSAVSYRRSTHPPPSILSSVKTPLTRFQDGDVGDECVDDDDGDVGDVGSVFKRLK